CRVAGCTMSDKFDDLDQREDAFERHLAGTTKIQKGALLSFRNKLTPPVEDYGLGTLAALGSWLTRPFFRESINFGDEPLGLICVGIEVVTDPSHEFDMAFVCWVLDCLDELSIAPRAAAVLGRAAAVDFSQARIDHTRLRSGEALDLDRVLPAIAEIVQVDEFVRADVFEN